MTSNEEHEDTRTAEESEVHAAELPEVEPAKQTAVQTAVQTAAQPSAPDLGDPALYINREISLLQFQQRVLEEAEDDSNPLLERLKFAAIVGSNLDEFFMVRVAGLKQQIAAGVSETPPDGMTPVEQLAAVREASLDLMHRTGKCVRDELLPAMSAEGIHVHDYDDLDAPLRETATRYFDEMVFPVLTPLAFDPGRPFPHISNLSLNLAVVIRDQDDQLRFARIKVPGTLPRLVSLGRLPIVTGADGHSHPGYHFVWLEQLIAAHMERLFPGMRIIESHPFRITRDADMAIQELEAADLLETIEESVRLRRFGSIVRITMNPDVPRYVRDLLIRELEVGPSDTHAVDPQDVYVLDPQDAYVLDPQDVYVLDPPLGLSGLMSLYRAVDRPDLRDPHFVPTLPAALADTKEPGAIFEAIRAGDILLHHPYDSFDPVVQFLEDAARDPDVLAIKQTLYRAGRDSPVVNALLEARQNMKQVAVLVELKARFDEESNIEWARKLEREGVHVVYGLLGLKTHSKIALVVRREAGRIRRYVHLGTGNYNAVTARLYTDMGLFTCDEDIGADATDLFNYLTGYSAKDDYRKLLVAPINLRRRLRELIERETEHARDGRGGHLMFKMNSLIDKRMIKSLYQASQAGVQVDLNVRGVCGIRPGLAGLSDNVRVVSIVGRFLEHSRAYYFRNGGDDKVYLGSADLMPRNLNRRVEVVFPIEDPRLIQRLRDDVLNVSFADNVKARLLRPEGTYERVPVAPGEEPRSSQEWFLTAHQR